MEKKLTIQNGFTLLEVLVAFFVLSIGLLAFISYQTENIHHIDHTYFESVAQNQIASFFERLKASQGVRAREREFNDWNEENARLLPSGHGAYSCDDTACTIQIFWLEKQRHVVAIRVEV